MATKSFKIEGWVTPPNGYYKAYFYALEISQTGDSGEEFKLNFIGEEDKRHFIFSRETLEYLNAMLSVKENKHINLATYQSLVMVHSRVGSEDRIGFYDGYNCEAKSTIHFPDGNLSKFVEALKQLLKTRRAA